MNPKLEKALLKGREVHRAKIPLTAEAKAAKNLQERADALAWIDEHLFTLIEEAAGEGLERAQITDPESGLISHWHGRAWVLVSIIGEQDDLWCYTPSASPCGCTCAPDQTFVYWDTLP